MKILLVDMQHSPHGSLSDDANTIKNIFLQKHTVEHLCLPDGSPISNILKFYKKISSTHYDRVIILSAKITQIVLTIPATLIRKINFIYHFMPVNRVRYHNMVLGILQFFFQIGVYGSGVKNVVDKILWKKKAFLVPSRKIDEQASKYFLMEKLNSQKVQVFIPGVRKGIRLLPNVPHLVNLIENKTLYKIEKIIIQTNEPLPADWRELPIKVVKFIDSDQYAKIYTNSLFVICEFDKEYEVRASGILLDALSYGCITIANNHPINIQYGYPHTLVTNTDHLTNLVEKLRQSTTEDIYYSSNNEKEGSDRWHAFLK
ncbi:hypothetical protein [Chromobacterium violaceum]|uniref:hypothetical protein n=1 Tax=Chromobacterium violaceum TaxID=536 RepID=UPI0012D2D1B8|nr:hypothetical protein [Chromobacterium violaceum]